jgi:hypothetical protein
LDKYQRLAYYLSEFVDVPTNDFKETYPNGFLVEGSHFQFDKNVMFQFFTQVVDDQYVLEQSEAGVGQIDLLSVRVIELKKRKSASDPEEITIGRSPDSDIILYNKLVSKNHAYLRPTPTDETCSLVDTGSTNGTFLNGEKITPNAKYHLSNIDEISFGPETKVVYFSSELFHSLLAKFKSAKPDPSTLE